MKTADDLPQLKLAIKDDDWLPFTTEKNSYKNLSLKIDESVDLGSPRVDYCSFWIDYIPRFRNKSE